jgi:hypothetical protein
MRMIIAADAPVERFLALLLEHPERFDRSDVPCCLQGLWEDALEIAHGQHQAGAPLMTVSPDMREYGHGYAA